jgi:hypothetical protein
MDITNTIDTLFSSTMPGTAQFDSLSGYALGRGIDAFMAEDYSKAVSEFRRDFLIQVKRGEHFEQWLILSDV